jgi:hypothetical protein
MRFTTRAHEWLADRIPWIQYPSLRAYRPWPRLTQKQIAWYSCLGFWLFVIAVSVWGNFL